MIKQLSFDENTIINHDSMNICDMSEINIAICEAYGIMGYSLSDFEYYNDELIHIFTLISGNLGHTHEINEYTFAVYDIETDPLYTHDPSDELVNKYKNSREYWEETIRNPDGLMVAFNNPDNTKNYMRYNDELSIHTFDGSTKVKSEVYYKDYFGRRTDLIILSTVESIEFDYDVNGNCTQFTWGDNRTFKLDGDIKTGRTITMNGKEFAKFKLKVNNAQQ